MKKPVAVAGALLTLGVMLPMVPTSASATTVTPNVSTCDNYSSYYDGKYYRAGNRYCSSIPGFTQFRVKVRCVTTPGAGEYFTTYGPWVGPGGTSTKFCDGTVKNARVSSISGEAR